MKIEGLIDVVNGFKTFDTMYELLKNGDYSFLNRECGTIAYPEIKWMIEYFIEKEECQRPTHAIGDEWACNTFDPVESMD